MGDCGSSLGKAGEWISGELPGHFLAFFDNCFGTSGGNRAQPFRGLDQFLEAFLNKYFGKSRRVFGESWRLLGGIVGRLLHDVVQRSFGESQTVLRELGPSIENMLRRQPPEIAHGP